MPDPVPPFLVGQGYTSPARLSPSRRRLGWALAWGLGWAALLNLSAQHPLLVRMESDAQEWLYAWRGPQQPSPEVVIVGIDGRIGLDRDSGAEHVPANGNSGQGESNGRTSGAEHLGQKVDFLLERANYAGLTLRLLEEAKARVVVLNLPSSFVVPQNLGNENLDAPLRQVVQRYPDRLVLATRSSESFGRSEINIYNHFLPFSSLRLEYLVPPEHVQGVVQYRVDRAGILRQAQLRGLYLRRDSQEEQMFASVEALAFAKYDPELGIPDLQRAISQYPRESNERIGELQQSYVHPRLTRGQLHLQDAATRFLDALLFPKPVLIGHQLGEVGILQLPLGANSGLAGHTGRDLEHAHDMGSPLNNKMGYLDQQNRRLTPESSRTSASTPDPCGKSPAVLVGQ